MSAATAAIDDTTAAKRDTEPMGAEPGVAPSDDAARRLADAVRPAGWSNPAPRARYDLVVIGGGTAGLVAAVGSASLGARVALVERRALGGDCLNTGCVPSKALIAAARAACAVRAASAYGIGATAPSTLDGSLAPPTVRVDFERVMARVRSIRADLAVHDSAERLTALGVDVFFGEGRFVDGRSIAIDGMRLRFVRALIATGTRPSVPSIPGLAEAGCRTTDEIFELTDLPARLGIIGAGASGCELAQAFARLGSRVTLLESAAAILPSESADAAAAVRQGLERDGVRVLVAVQVTSVTRQADGARRIEWAAASPPERGEAADAAGAAAVDDVLIAAGRLPNLDALDLARAGIDVVDGRLVVGPDLRTTGRRIFAAGDVASASRFTHAADAMARLVVRNALFPLPGTRRFDPLSIPRCIFTDPEVAHIGQPAGASAVRRSVRIGLAAVDRFRLDAAGSRYPASGDDLCRAASDRASVESDGHGFATLHLGRGDRIVGASVVGDGAGEIISLLAVAMAHDIGAAALSDLVLPYPTRSLAVRALADAHQRTRITPNIGRLARVWLRLRRFM